MNDKKQQKLLVERTFQAFNNKIISFVESESKTPLCKERGNNDVLRAFERCGLKIDELLSRECKKQIEYLQSIGNAKDRLKAKKKKKPTPEKIEQKEIDAADNVLRANAAHWKKTALVHFAESVFFSILFDVLVDRLRLSFADEQHPAMLQNDYRGLSSSALMSSMPSFPSLLEDQEKLCIKAFKELTQPGFFIYAAFATFKRVEMILRERPNLLTAEVAYNYVYMSMYFGTRTNSMRVVLGFFAFAFLSSQEAIESMAELLQQKPVLTVHAKNGRFSRIAASANETDARQSSYLFDNLQKYDNALGSIENAQQTVESATSQAVGEIIDGALKFVDLVARAVVDSSADHATLLANGALKTHATKIDAFHSIAVLRRLMRWTCAQVALFEVATLGFDFNRFGWITWLSNHVELAINVLQHYHQQVKDAN